MAAILVIDDDRAMRQTLVRMLVAGGHSVSEAANGTDALRLLPTCAATIVITDVFMPEKDGIETVREIRSLNRDLKILAISGGGRAGRFDFLSVAKSFGANAALQKPFRAQALLDAVAALIADG
jgi:two-component system, chemotaxis family, chemotaxis protein CheY